MEPNTQPTQSGVRMSQGLNGVRERARKNKQERFTALLHHVSVDLLRDSYYGLKRKAAPGVDGVTWKEYETGLEDRLKDLHGRVHRGAYRSWVQLAAHVRTNHVHAIVDAEVQPEKAKALGTAWKYAMVMEGSGCAGSHSICNRGAGVRRLPDHAFTSHQWPSWSISRHGHTPCQGLWSHARHLDTHAGGLRSGPGRLTVARGRIKTWNSLGTKHRPHDPSRPPPRTRPGRWDAVSRRGRGSHLYASLFPRHRPREEIACRPKS